MKGYTNEQISELIDSHIHKQRDRELLKRRLVDGITYEKLGEEFELTDRQVKRIVYKNMNTLIRFL